MSDNDNPDVICDTISVSPRVKRRLQGLIDDSDEHEKYDDVLRDALGIASRRHSDREEAIEPTTFDQ